MHTLTPLGIETLPTSTMRTRAVIAGLLSDVWMSMWIAFFLSAPAALLVFLSRRHRLHSLGTLRSLAVALFAVLAGGTLIVGFLIGSQIAYVEFFGTLLSWQHVRYLADVEFLRASADEIARPAVLVSGFGTPAIAMLIWFAGLPILALAAAARKPPAKRFPGLDLFRYAPLALLIFGILCQVAKVQTNTQRVGWRVPAVLRLNFAENTLRQWWRAGKMPQVSRVEFLGLQAHVSRLVRTEQPPAAIGPVTLGRLKDTLESAPIPGDTHGLGDALRGIVRHRVLAEAPLYVFFVVLESFRPEESATYEPQLSESGTPFFDELARASVVFENVYTSGGVTRAGQEALLCGLLSGEMTSAMRDLPSASPRCLPRRLKETFGNAKVFSSWWHGGDFNFDSQGTFWRRQGVDFLLAREDFLAEKDGHALPKTWWGVSDFTLVERFRARLHDTPPGARIFLNTFLSVTNHPSWVTPVDFPVALYRGDPERWESVKPLLTTRYTDEALRRLVDSLRAAPCYLCDAGSIWDNALVLVSNDHGTLMPSLSRPEGYRWDVSEEGDVKAARAASRASFLLTGGLVHSAGLGSGISLPVRDVVLRSQTDAFATFTDLFGLQDVATVGDSLFAPRRRWPVVVDLGNRIFVPGPVPGTGRVFDRDDFLRGRGPGLTDGGKGVDGVDGVDVALARSAFLGIQQLHGAGLSGR